MGLFSRKCDMTHAQKALRAYDSYREEVVDRLFPDGVAQAGDIITGMAEVLGIDTEKCSADRYEELLNLYSETYVGRVMNGKDTPDLVANLHKRYKKLCGGREEDAVAYALSLIDAPAADGAEEDDVPVSFDAEDDDGPLDADEDPFDAADDDVFAEDLPDETAGDTAADAEDAEDETVPRDTLIRRAYKKTLGKFELAAGKENPAMIMLEENRKDLVKKIMKEYGEDGTAASMVAYYAALYAAAVYTRGREDFSGAEKGLYTFMKHNMLLDMDEIPDEARRLVKDKKEKTLKPLNYFLEKADVPDTWNEMTGQEQKRVLRCACMLGARQGIAEA